MPTKTPLHLALAAMSGLGTQQHEALCTMSLALDVSWAENGGGIFVYASTVFSVRYVWDSLGDVEVNGNELELS